MKRWAGISIFVIVVGLFAFLVPVIASGFPTTFCTFPCHSNYCIYCETTKLAPNVNGSLTYHLFGYGGVVMPDHSYLVITKQ